MITSVYIIQHGFGSITGCINVFRLKNLRYSLNKMCFEASYFLRRKIIQFKLYRLTAVHSRQRSAIQSDIRFTGFNMMNWMKKAWTGSNLMASQQQHTPSAPGSPPQCTMVHFDRNRVKLLFATFGVGLCTLCSMKSFS